MDESKVHGPVLGISFRGDVPVTSSSKSRGMGPVAQKAFYAMQCLERRWTLKSPGIRVK